ncbi:TIGR03943 family protein [Brevibacillus sp. SYP-B805]|uniref:TIGR03943 family putative permease subunit n=1 Tax=Brevibacillus sp. SYP-B805 TaxID=1578199 RepID=UPI0013EC54CF|nr:TIGR03943 family protein [Brevibacillus sp. SYP-B805]NGQ95420.1 TIGR03943 family protein [Brevibacillus sp. SYP-B805]
MSETKHYLLRSLILLGFSFLLGKLLLTGEINYYLAPRLQGLTYVTLCIMVILTISCFVQALTGTRRAECDCGEAHSLPKGFWKTTIVYGLFVLPLAMGFLLPNKLLGSAVAEMKGVNLLQGNAKELMANSPLKEQIKKSQPEKTAAPPAAAPTQQAAAPKTTTETDKSTKPMTEQELRKMFDQGFGDFYTDMAVSFYKQPVIEINDQNYLDAMTILDIYVKEFNGRKLETMGFVYRQPDFKANEFVAARFSVSCCTADASVTGILIQSPDAKKFPNDSWVKVTGTLKLTSLDGNEFLMLVADKITPVKPPKTPYVYYNYNNVGQ